MREGSLDLTRAKGGFPDEINTIIFVQFDFAEDLKFCCYLNAPKKRTVLETDLLMQNGVRIVRITIYF